MYQVYYEHQGTVYYYVKHKEFLTEEQAIEFANELKKWNEYNNIKIRKI